MRNIVHLLFLTFATLLIIQLTKTNSERASISKESVNYSLESYLEKKKAKRKAGYVKNGFARNDRQNKSTTPHPH